MSETLGSLCDKLTIVKLKQWHSEDKNRLNSLKNQETLLISEINEYVNAVIKGEVPIERLTFPANKVYKNNNYELSPLLLTHIGSIFSALAEVNCALWHEQEKIYEFEKVLPNQKNHVIKQVAILNLKRNHFIDELDQQFAKLVKANNEGQ